MSEFFGDMLLSRDKQIAPNESIGMHPVSPTVDPKSQVNWDTQMSRDVQEPADIIRNMHSGGDEMGPTVPPQTHPTTSANGMPQYSSDRFATPSPSSQVPSSSLASVKNETLKQSVPSPAGFAMQSAGSMSKNSDVNNSQSDVSNHYLPLHAGSSALRRNFKRLIFTIVVIFLLVGAITCAFASQILPRPSVYNQIAKMTRIMPYDK